MSSRVQSIFLAMALFFSFICVSHFTLGQDPSANVKVIHVKFKEKFKPKTPVSGRTNRSGIPQMDALSEKHHALIVRRIFPDAGKHEVAHRAYGLHLWYEITFDEQTKLARVMADYGALDYFDHIAEPRPYSHGDGITPNNPENNILVAGSNDPLFQLQWHFQNTGQNGGTGNADINLVNAWRVETGSPDVIVAVLDGGIDFDHPDLKGSLWVNPGEIDGNLLDDDHNGYVDDVHGFGFGDTAPVIYPDGHGTHVAGTIAAVTNNGIGVAGIAGGDGTANGVRLMSCATFGTFRIGGFEEALVYAADNGAVVAQNSWGGGSTAIEDAINYFINRAGFDNTDANFSKNIQTGPMAGGIVVFAAGNSNTSDPVLGYPASYSKVIAVGSTDRNDKKSGFSNYGRWVDISAPGEQVASTFTNRRYALASGTSMACPHVSGVAALVISKLKSKGLNPSQVWNRIRAGARSLSPTNPDYIGQLGAGRLDALIALREPDEIPPANIVDFQVDRVHHSSLVLSWTATGESGNDGQSAEFDIRYSAEPITEQNFDFATRAAGIPQPPPAGTKVKFELRGLTARKNYYVAIKAIDVFYNKSDLSSISVTTLGPPVPELLAPSLSQDLYTGGVSARNLQVKNNGEDELIVRLAAPRLDPAKVGTPRYQRGRLFAVNSSRSHVEELDIRSGQVIRSIPLPVSSSGSPDALAFDGAFLYYGKYNNVYKINATTGEVLRSFPIEGVENIRGLAWSGRYLYVSSPTVSEVDSDDGTIVRRVDLQSQEMSFGGNRGTIFRVASNSLGEVNITNGELQAYSTEPVQGVGYSDVENIVFVLTGSRIRAIEPTTGKLLYSFSSRGATAIASDEYAPNWLQYDEQVLTVASGGTATFPMNFVATDLATSRLDGSVRVMPLNLSGGDMIVPVALNVTSARDIEFVNTLDFGSLYVGYPSDTVIQIENRGYSTLAITEIQSNNPKVTTSLTSLTLDPGQKTPIKITVAATAVGPIEATLRISSNDPDEGVLSIPVSGSVKIAPAIELSPASITTTLAENEKKTLHFTATNTGGSTVSWTLNSSSGLPEFVQASAGSTVSQLETKAPLIGDFVVRESSPERIGCLTYDEQSRRIYGSSPSSGKLYSYDPTANKWTEVGLTPAVFYHGTALNRKIYYAAERLYIYSIDADQWSTVDYPVAGSGKGITNDGNDLYVAVDRALYKYDPGDNTWQVKSSSPAAVGGLSFHSGLIFGHQAPGGFTGDGTSALYKYYVDTDTWISTVRVPGKGGLGSAIDRSTMRLFVLSSTVNDTNARIQMSILDIRQGVWTKDILPFATDISGSIVYVGTPGISGIYFSSGSTLKFAKYETTAASNWMKVSPVRGELAPGAVQNFDVNLDATTLIGGTYHEQLSVVSSRPRLRSTLPLDVTVLGAPDITLDKTSYDLQHVNTSALTQINIRNSGTTKLVVSSVSIDDPQFTLSTSVFQGNPQPVTSFDLEIGESVNLTATFTPTSLGPKTGTYVFHTNDPDESEVEFVLKGIGATLPVLEFPTTLTANLRSGQMLKRSFTITNSGGMPVYYGTDREHNASWLSNAGSAPIQPGQSITAEVTFDASGLSAGTYTENLQMYGTFPSFQLAGVVPVTLNVSNATNLLLSKNEVVFGDQFVDYRLTQPLEIRNNAILHLVITAISSDNSAFELTTASGASIPLPLTIAPGAAVQAQVWFNPRAIRTENGVITFTSNDPDEGTLALNVTGNGIGIPDIGTTTATVKSSLYINESESQSVWLNNAGSGRLQWQVLAAQGSKPDETPSITQPFTLKGATPNPFTALSYDPASNRVYAYDPYNQKLNRYSFTYNTWSDPSNSIGPTRRGSSVILDSRMYVVYPDVDTSRIHVYTFPFEEWTTIPNQLGNATGSITTDGKLLYLAGGGLFKSYNPKTGEWKTLSIPTINLNGTGGLSYHNGIIYAHEGGGRGFAGYTVATDTWNTLVPLPADALLGSTIDTKRGRYLAYGPSAIYEYDIHLETWTPYYNPLFNAGDGGIIYHPGAENEGVYFLQGTAGSGFAKFSPGDGPRWLRVAPLLSNIELGAKEQVAIHLNASGLIQGTYKGSIRFTANNPGKTAVEIPVTLDVSDPFPRIETSGGLDVTVGATGSYNFNVKITNNGRNDLIWDFGVLPAALSAGKNLGSVRGYNSETIPMTLDLKKVTANLNFILVVKSNDPTKPVAEVAYSFKANRKPVAKEIPTQNLTDRQVAQDLSAVFSDPDGDQLMYTASSSNANIAGTLINNGHVIITPVSPGTADITVTAKDSFEETATTTFMVNVAAVTGLDAEPVVTTFTSSPNPFEREFTIRYHVSHPAAAEALLVDIAGRIVLRSGLIEEKSGENMFVMNGSGLSAGIYQCVVLRDGKRAWGVRVVKR